MVVRAALSAGLFCNARTTACSLLRVSGAATRLLKVDWTMRANAVARPNFKKLTIKNPNTY